MRCSSFASPLLRVDFHRTHDHRSRTVHNVSMGQKASFQKSRNWTAHDQFVPDHAKVSWITGLANDSRETSLLA